MQVEPNTKSGKAKTVPKLAEAEAPISMRNKRVLKEKIGGDVIVSRVTPLQEKMGDADVEGWWTGQDDQGCCEGRKECGGIEFGRRR